MLSAAPRNEDAQNPRRPTRHRAALGHNWLVSAINLSGGEITILKTIGVGGGMMAGNQLAERTNEMDSAEFLDTLGGLMAMDYVSSNRVSVRTMDDVRSASFRVNSAHAHEIREAVYPSRKKAETGRRRRRS